MKIIATLAFIMTFILIFQTGCKKENEGSGTSTHYSTSSGGMSGNCQQCHTPGNGEAAAWTVAGTVFNQDLSTPSPNGTVYIWKVVSGTWKLVASLEVDANGNFYTSNSILPSGSFYPQVEGASGDLESMPVFCTSGSCNRCHGISQPRIWVK